MSCFSNLLLRKIFFSAAVIFFSFNLSSCATYRSTEAKLDDLVARGNIKEASVFLESQKKSYGKNQELLYLFDHGYINHIQGECKQSIISFADAKKLYDQLYTKSISRTLASWVTNDYALEYRGEDFERVMVNVFQSLNYILLDDLQGALVEARQADEVLKLINSRYDEKSKNVYKEDAFCRLLTGIIYEASLNNKGYNDAYIAYNKAKDIYEEDYAKNYSVRVPLFLKENLLSAADFMGQDVLVQYKNKYPDVRFVSLKEKQKKAEVYLIQYNGFSPVKEEIDIPIPLPEGYIMNLAFPRYEKRQYSVVRSEFVAQLSDSVSIKIPTELVQDITAIAVLNLENRRGRTIAKVLAQAAGKYFSERAIEEQIAQGAGNDAAVGFKVLSSLYNIFTNRADLRSWSTLPGEIRVARLLLDPGVYNLKLLNFDSNANQVEKVDIANINLTAGQKKFFLVRTAK